MLIWELLLRWRQLPRYAGKWGKKSSQRDGLSQMTLTLGDHPAIEVQRCWVRPRVM
jgi:hypothetical protein